MIDTADFLLTKKSTRTAWHTRGGNYTVHEDKPHKRSSDVGLSWVEWFESANKIPYLDTEVFSYLGKRNDPKKIFVSLLGNWSFQNYSHRKAAITEQNVDVHGKLFKKIYTLIMGHEEDVEKVSSQCAYIAMYICSLLVELDKLPSRISKSSEGSIAFSFVSKLIFHSIEVFNEGEIVHLVDRNGDISANDISFEQLGEVLKSII